MDINKIILKFLNDKASGEELNFLEGWKSESEENLKELSELLAINKAANSLNDYKNFDVESALVEIDKRLSSAEPIENKLIGYKKAGLIVISLIILLSIIFYFISNEENHPKVYYAENIINDIRLEDNSKVSLDKNSQLTVPDKFTEDRYVSLQGRAFFDIEHLPSEQNFVVSIPGAEIEVLGTKFSVSSYENLKEIAVFEGVVAVKMDKRVVKIKKGEKIKMLNNDLLKLAFDNPNYLSWLNGKLTYEHTPINNVLKDLEWNYLTNITLTEGLDMSECKVTSTFQNLSLNEIFKELAFTTKIEYDNTEDEIIVKGIKCY